MLPLDLDLISNLAGQTLECLAELLPSASPRQRDLLLQAMNALDDIEATISMATDLAPNPQPVAVAPSLALAA